MFLKKLAKLLPLWVALGSAGAALHASPEAKSLISPDLHIVQSAKKHDKKQKDGFTALLRRSARHIGSGLVQVIANAGNSSKRHVARQSRKPKSTGDKLVLRRDISDSKCLIGLSAVPQDHQADLLQLQKSGLHAVATLALGHKMVSVRARPPNLAQKCPFELSIHAVIFELSASGYKIAQWGVPQSMARAASGAKGPTPANHHAGEIGSIGVLMPIASHCAASATARTESKYHFTIDLTKPAALLTHGAMGARTALSGNRSRDYRA